MQLLLSAKVPPARRRGCVPAGRIFPVAAMVVLAVCGPIQADKAVIGSVAEVTLLPWEIHLQARVDTGAATTSLGVHVLQQSRTTVEFEFRGPGAGRRVQLPIVDRRRVRSSDGRVEERPVVEMTVSFGGESFQTQVMLDDRSRMTYDMLIGRRTLSGRFVVDVDAPGKAARKAAGE